MEQLVGLLACVFVVMLFVKKGGRRKAPPDPLDRVVFRFNKVDSFTLRDLDRSILCIGGPGSGKSSGSLPLVEYGALRNGCGGLILESKPEELEFHAKMFAAAGRTPDRILFGPGYQARLNLLDAFQEQGADARELTRLFMTLGETLSNQGPGGGNEEPIWKQLKESHLETMIEILLQGRGKLRIMDMVRFIDSAPYSDEERKSDAWINGFCSQSFFLANSNKQRGHIQLNDYQIAFNKWLVAFPRMPEKMRGSFIGDLQSVFHPLSTGIARDLLATETNVKISELGRGKWLDVAMWPTSFGASGLLTCGAIKYAVQKYVLSRKAGAFDPSVLIISDEYQQHITSFDADFLAQSRSHRGSMFALTQSIHPIYAAMKGRGAEHLAESLMTLYGTKLIHTVNDSKTATWASDLLGRRLETFISVSEKPGSGMGEMLFGDPGVTSTHSSQYQPVIQPSVFLAGGLRSGGPANGNIVDGMAIKNGQPYSSGENYVYFSVKQPGR